MRSKPVRRTITHELPSDFDLGTINAAATQRTVGQIMGVDCPPGCFPTETIVKFQKKYTGGRTNLGSAVLQLTKDEHDAIVCMLLKTEPWQIGKSIINSINKAAKGKGKEPEMKVEASFNTKRRSATPRPKANSGESYPQFEPNS